MFDILHGEFCVFNYIKQLVIFYFYFIVADLLQKMTVFRFEFELRLNSRMHS